VNLEERSFSGNMFRPRPEIHCEDSGNLCVVATPWGPRSAARKVIQSIVDFFHSARSDEEVTSPFQVMTCLSPIANNLRVSVMLANDTVFREDNRAEYQAGVELFVLARHRNECVWTQVGGPNIFLDRRGFDLCPLGTIPDLSLSHSTGEGILAPLPGQLLGLNSTTNFSVQTLRLQPADRMVLVHRTLVPPKFQALPDADRNLQKFSQCLARHSADMPFWLGVLSL
jgi:hypothetical protein